MKLEFSRQIFEKYSNFKFNESTSSGSGQTDMTKLIITFRNFANAPKKVQNRFRVSWTFALFKQTDQNKNKISIRLRHSAVLLRTILLQCHATPSQNIPMSRDIGMFICMLYIYLYVCYIFTYMYVCMYVTYYIFTYMYVIYLLLQSDSNKLTNQM